MATIAERNRAWTKGRKAFAVLIVLVGLTFSLTGCFSSSFAYFNHKSGGTQMYFKVPEAWHVFTAKQLAIAANGPLSQAEINSVESTTWQTTFSAEPHPSIDILLPQYSRYPNGWVFSKLLTENQRDSYSMASMRAQILGTDPLAQSATTSPYNVLSYTEFTRPGGIRGSKMVTQITTTGGESETLSQIIAVDPNTDYVFGIGISCNASCWGTDGGLIDQVLNSWNLKEK